MSKDNRSSVDPDSLFTLKLPTGLAKDLNELKNKGEIYKDRLIIHFDKNKPESEQNFDQKTMRDKTVDRPRVVRTMAPFRIKIFYQTADKNQMLTCKEVIQQSPIEEESSAKNKEEDPSKVIEKYLSPRDTPPNVSEIEPNSQTWKLADILGKILMFQIVKVEGTDFFLQHVESKRGPSTSHTGDAASGEEKELGCNSKCSTSKGKAASTSKKPETSALIEVFEGNLTRDDLEDASTHPTNEDSQAGSATSSSQANTTGATSCNRKNCLLRFDLQMLKLTRDIHRNACIHDKNTEQAGTSQENTQTSSDGGEHSHDSKDSIAVRITKVLAELEALLACKKRTQREIVGMANMALRQSFQDTLHTLDHEIAIKKKMYQSLQSLKKFRDS